jgi:hypothetical protein
MRRRYLATLILALTLTGCAGLSPRPVPAPVPAPPPVVDPAPLPSPPPADLGPVRLDGAAFADDTGPFNALGTSLFWALWGEANDPDRLDANLAHLAAHDVDYIRLLGMVGTETWADRRIDPKASDYWDVADRLFARLARHGLRAQVTVFADAQVMLPDRAEREAFLDRWVAFLNERRSQVFLIEIANEAWQNGFADDAASLVNLGHFARERTAIPVALSAPQETEVAFLYRTWPGVATMHYDRDTSRADGPWRPVRQPWGWPGEYFSGGGVPPAVSNNEPIGPASSVAADDDPTRLAMAYVATFISGNGAYVYDPGSGIRGGGANDLARGRKANLYEENPAIIEALQRWRNWLPGGLAKGPRFNAQWAGFPWDGSARAVDEGRIIRAYNVGSLTVVLGIRDAHEVTSPVARRYQFRDPLTTEVIHDITVEAGGRFTIPADRTAWVIEGVAP